MTVSFSISYAVLWALVIFVSLVVLGLTRAVYQLKRHRSEEESVESPGSELEGAPAPVFSALDVFGRTIDSDEFGDQLTAFLFVSTGCPNCLATLNHLEGLKAKAEGRVVVICRDGQEACRHVAETYETSVPVISDEDLRINKLFGAPAAPAAVLVEGGRIRRVGYPSSSDEIQRMVEQQRGPAAELSLELAGEDGAHR